MEIPSCDICKIQYSLDRFPIILNCGHSYCVKCIYEYIDKYSNNYSDNNIEIRCFTCKEISYIKSKNGIKYIKNFALIEIIDQLHQKNDDIIKTNEKDKKEFNSKQKILNLNDNDIQSISKIGLIETIIKKCLIHSSLNIIKDYFIEKIKNTKFSKLKMSFSEYLEKLKELSLNKSNHELIIKETPSSNFILEKRDENHKYYSFNYSIVNDVNNCYYTIYFIKNKDDLIYSYEGNVEFGNVKSGFGIEVNICENEIYIGYFKDNKRCGFGILIKFFVDTLAKIDKVALIGKHKYFYSIYEGGFHENKKSGKGIEKRDQIEYDGSWISDKMNGEFMIKIESNGQEQNYIKGNYTDNIKNGLFEEELEDHYFKGKYVFGLKEGFGVYKTKFNAYSGEFFNDLKHGIGKETTSEYKFSGLFHQDLKKKGKYYCKINKFTYIGDFSDDIENTFNGNGQIQYDENENENIEFLKNNSKENKIIRFEGIFINGKKSSGVIYYNDGSTKNYKSNYFVNRQNNKNADNNDPNDINI